jgi:GTP-binding protein
MTNLFLLIDIRHEPQKKDLDFLEFIGENGVPFAIVFTKADKLSAAKQGANVKAYLKVLKQQWEELPPYFVTSSSSRLGRDELLNYIEEINNSIG